MPELLALRIASPFLLRTAVPPIASAEGRRVVGLRRLGKRIVFALEGGLFRAPGAAPRCIWCKVKPR
jgi:hypothetical protein